MSATDRLGQIEARANAATEGPWGSDEYTEIDPDGLYELSRVIAPDPDDGEDYAIGVVHVGILRNDAEFIAHARTDVPALVAALRAVLDRHEPETCWQSDPDSEWSYDTPEDAAAYEEMDPAECTSFVICRECGRVEKADAERQAHGEFSGYAESLYPCPTVRAIEEALS